MAANKMFVAVTDSGHFHVGGKPFFFAGANCYYLMTRAADQGCRHEVLEVLDAVANTGLTVIRTWAFCDGQEWNALQPQPGVFDERVFQGLDWLLAEAARRRLRILFALTNYWEAYGGMLQYVKWSCERRGLPLHDKLRADQFYTDPACQDIFNNFMATLVSRVNTVTQCPYRDDPTIFGWTLCNEPRCEGDYSASILQGWLASASEFLKSLDPNHLIAGGSEGFFGSSTPDLLVDNPYDMMKSGCDFLRHNSLPCIDFCTMHLWVDSWLPKADDEHKGNFARRWINSHADLCAQQLHKPLILSEFGKTPPGDVRAAFYSKVYGRVMHHAKAGHGLAGSCFWSTAHAAYEDYDSFTVYLSGGGRGPHCREDDSATVRIVQEHATAMLALAHEADRECSVM